MSTKPNQTLTTARDVLEYLWGSLCKMRNCRIENDFDFGYERALNDVMYHLMRSTSAECAVKDPTLTTVEGVLDKLYFAVLEDMMAYPPEDDFLQGYGNAFEDLMDQLWAVLPEAKWAPNAERIPETRDPGAKVINLADGRRTMETKAQLVTKDDLLHRRNV
jgi:hypothetical protein